MVSGLHWGSPLTPATPLVYVRANVLVHVHPFVTLGFTVACSCIGFRARPFLCHLPFGRVFSQTLVLDFPRC